MNLIEQEVSTERWIDIPDEVMENAAHLAADAVVSRLRAGEKPWAHRRRFTTRTEGFSPAGSHKPNTALAPGLLQQEVRHQAPDHGGLAPASGAAALAMACQLFGLTLKVYMVRISFQQKPFRKLMMQTWGAECVASPSMDTQVGRKFLAGDARYAGKPRHRHQRGHRRCRQPAKTAGTRWAAC